MAYRIYLRVGSTYTRGSEGFKTEAQADRKAVKLGQLLCEIGMDDWATLVKADRTYTTIDQVRELELLAAVEEAVAA